MEKDKDTKIVKTIQTDLGGLLRKHKITDYLFIGTKSADLEEESILAQQSPDDAMLICTLLNALNNLPHLRCMIAFSYGAISHLFPEIKRECELGLEYGQKVRPREGVITEEEIEKMAKDLPHLIRRRKKRGIKLRQRKRAGN